MFEKPDTRAGRSARRTALPRAMLQGTEPKLLFEINQQHTEIRKYKLSTNFLNLLKGLWLSFQVNLYLNRGMVTF